MIRKRHLLAIFACLHSLKMLPVYCGSISFVVVTAPTHCKTDRIPSSSLSPCGLGWFVLCQWPQNTREVRFPPFFHQLRSHCIHPFNLFLLTSRMLRIIFESRQKLQQRTGCRPLWDTLFPIYWVPWQFSVWPVDSVCVRPSLGLALGPCALFHILYDVYTSVYSRLFPLFESFLNPFFSLTCSVSFLASIGRLVLPSS